MDYSFALKKFISFQLSPLTLSLELMVFGLGLILLSRLWRTVKKHDTRGIRQQWVERIAKVLIAVGVIFLYLCSISPISDRLTYHLENQFPVLKRDGSGKLILPQKPNFVVVLAGGINYLPEGPIVSRLRGATLARLTQGVVYWKEFPETTLVVTGTPYETQSMAEVAEKLGVDPGKIYIENLSRDTKDHPRFLKPLLKDQPFLLVTSATHMPRAMRLFQGQGLKPIPAPGQIRVYFGEEAEEEVDFDIPFAPDDLLPSSEKLGNTDAALHEYYGLWWAKLRKQTGDGKLKKQETAPKGAKAQPLLQE